MEINVSYSAALHNQTLAINVTDKMETKDEEKIKVMKEIMREFVPALQQDQIETRCIPAASSNLPRLANGKADQPNVIKMISDKQIGLLKKQLHERNIPIADFCLQHGVNQVEELSMADARVIIRDLSKN